MKRAVLLILFIVTLVTGVSCSTVSKDVDPNECYGYSFNMKIYDYYGDSYDDCTVEITSAGKGNFKQTYTPESGICSISLTKGEYILTVADNSSGGKYQENIIVVSNGKKTFLEVKSEFGYDRSRTNDELLKEKRKELIEEYGLISNETFYEVDSVDENGDHKKKSEFFSQEGVLTASFNDLDLDGYNELYLLRIADGNFITQVYYVADDMLKMSEAVSQPMPEAYFDLRMNMKNYLLPVDGGLNICTDIYYQPFLDSGAYMMELSAYRFAHGEVMPCMILKGEGFNGINYEVVTYSDGVESDRRSVIVDENNEDTSILPALLEGIGYPSLDASDLSSKDAFLGGYGNYCSYFDNESAIGILSINSKYISSDYIVGNESYMVSTFTDKTDTHALFGELTSSDVEFDPYELPSAYKEIIDLLINEKMSWSSGSIPGLPEVSELYRYCNDLSDVGYALLDIEGDGSDELIIGGGSEDDFDIFDIYTLKDNKAVHLVDSSERNMYYVVNDGSIYNTWSGGAANSGESWYKINGGTLTLSVSVFCDAPDAATDIKDYWFVSHTPDHSDKKNVTESEAISSCGNKDKILIGFRSFEEYNKEAY